MSTILVNLLPEQRTKALLYFFGWQGGTVHQLASVTGCSVHDLLYSTDTSSADLGGMSAIRTCSLPWRANVLAPENQGNLAFWQGAIIGYWITGQLED
jgi:hypothetical protein